jgi:hypothetical protein
MNLLDETKGAISQSEHSTDDVRFVGFRDEKLGIPWSQAEKVLDIDYDDGYGSQEIAADLVVAFTDGGFLRREEYDGSEWWEYEPPFRGPETQKPFKTREGAQLLHTVACGHQLPDGGNGGMSDMRSFIKVEHSRFTLILRKGMLPFHWIAESRVFPDKGYVTAVRERANYGAVWALSSMGALDQVMLSIWEDIKWLDERMD